MVHRNSANIACPFHFYVCLCLRDRYCCSAADCSGSCHTPAPSYFEEITRCRRKFDWRWPGNPNGRSKFHNLGLFTFTRSQLTLRLRLRGFWRLLKIAQTAHNRHQIHRRDDQDRSKCRKCENLFLRNQTKCLEKVLFPAMNAAAIDGIAHCFFFCYHWQRLLFSHSKNNFSTTWPSPKNRDIHIVEFFVDSIYSKTIDIIRNFFFYYYTEGLCVKPAIRITAPFCR